MSTRMLSRIAAIALLIMIASVPAQAYIPYDTHVSFLDLATKDMLRLLPRAMGSYIYQNRYDFMRGMTFMTREIQSQFGEVQGSGRNSPGSVRAPEPRHSLLCGSLQRRRDKARHCRLPMWPVGSV